MPCPARVISHHATSQRMMALNPMAPTAATSDQALSHLNNPSKTKTPEASAIGDDDAICLLRSYEQTQQLHCQHGPGCAHSTSAGLTGWKCNDSNAQQKRRVRKPRRHPVHDNKEIPVGYKCVGCATDIASPVLIRQSVRPSSKHGGHPRTRTWRSTAEASYISRQQDLRHPCKPLLPRHRPHWSPTNTSRCCRPSPTTAAGRTHEGIPQHQVL
ncbi:hypothetical protein COO60DRAFT_1546014 [Scenedesmus sp. NREL 46B-D3]|nr:hypothetical protein COO60DRAFT_1546014 [Scenedesmus sp. NREL 46B-D3]